MACAATCQTLQNFARIVIAYNKKLLGLGTLLCIVLKQVGTFSETVGTFLPIVQCDQQVKTALDDDPFDG